ncbi:hypothetical protein G5C65_36535 [Streptomyces sp. SB3404]|uniref:Uncharacterized protein n=2 Tax=Streptomyces boncukensis TaxID=2711219 RepID=A0A6G4X993_9ACTN|nr:hypothetical protein [Streptomyces boncukensis]NGO73732.1 hypothetical protein [Streptomyces boncukensis]
MTGGQALAGEIDRVVRAHGIASPVTSRRGLNARLRYLNSPAGRTALREAGAGARTIRDWYAGRTAPSRASREKIDAAYWERRRANLIRSGQLKRYFDNDGRGVRMEIYAVDQTNVPEKYRRPNVQDRSIQARYVWDDAVDAWEAGDTGTLDEIWDDLIADLDSDWIAYAYVAGIGTSA